MLHHSADVFEIFIDWILTVRNEQQFLLRRTYAKITSQVRCPTYKDNVSNTARVDGACVVEVAAHLRLYLCISTRNNNPTASSQHPG